jgi:predicted HicB family RNase H-like nuclease
MVSNGTHTRNYLSSEEFAKIERVPYNPPRASMRKEDRIGVRVPAELKRTLMQIAKNEGRSLAQICEILLRGGASSYAEDGPKYLQRLLSRQKKESSE